MTELRVAYHSPFATVYHGRAEDALTLIPKESIDLIVTDPPYGVEWQSNRRTVKFDQIAGDGADGASREAVRNVLTECVRVVGQNRHLYVFGPTDVLEGLKVSEPVSMIWDKGMMGGGDTTAAWGPSHEPITFAVSKFRHAGEAGKSAVPARIRKGTILSYTRPTGRKVRHQSEKPVGLLRELIESSSRQGELVGDFYAGVLSTAVAAIVSGRRAVVCELVEHNVNIGIERIKRAEALYAEMVAA